MAMRRKLVSNASKRSSVLRRKIVESDPEATESEVSDIEVSDIEATKVDSTDIEVTKVDSTDIEVSKILSNLRSVSHNLNIEKIESNIDLNKNKISYKLSLKKSPFGTIIRMFINDDIYQSKPYSISIEQIKSIHNDFKENAEIIVNDDILILKYHIVLVEKPIEFEFIRISNTFILEDKICRTVKDIYTSLEPISSRSSSINIMYNKEKNILYIKDLIGDSFNKIMHSLFIYNIYVGNNFNQHVYPIPWQVKFDSFSEFIKNINTMYASPNENYYMEDQNKYLLIELEKLFIGDNPIPFTYFTNYYHIYDKHNKLTFSEICTKLNMEDIKIATIHFFEMKKFTIYDSLHDIHIMKILNKNTNVHVVHVNEYISKFSIYNNKKFNVYQHKKVYLKDIKHNKKKYVDGVVIWY
jgi:hypothetical protein